jgi:hypothetical protein
MRAWEDAVGPTEIDGSIGRSGPTDVQVVVRTGLRLAIAQAARSPLAIVRPCSS